MNFHEEQNSSTTKTCPSCGLELSADATVCPRDGTNLQQTLSSDLAFQNYELLGIIGQGGMGIIYKARHLVLDKLVAIKTIHSSLYTPEVVRRFQIEGRAASSISHPNIVAVYDLGTTRFGQPFMIMEYISGRTLADLLRQEGPLSAKKFIEIFSQACSALAAAHRASIVHRDLKPSNVMLAKDTTGGESVRIMDFGIAKILSESPTADVTKTGETLGSPLYMSPEQARSTRTDFRSDLYSLGCVMYECLTGSPPFQGATLLDTLLMHMEKAPPPMREVSLGREIDPRLERVVMRLLSKEPEGRYASMDDLLDALGNYKHLPLPTIDTNLSEHRAAADKRRKMLIAMTSISAVIAVSIGFVGLRFPRKIPIKSEHISENDKLSSSVLSTDNVGPSVIDIRKRLSRKPIELDLDDSMQMFPVKDSDLEPLETADFLKRVEIRYCDVTDKGLEHLRNLINLESIKLVGNPKLCNLHALKRLVNLDNVDVSGSPINRDGLQVLAQLPALENLTMSNTDISSEDLDLLANARQLKQLTMRNATDQFVKKIDQLRIKLPNCQFNTSATDSSVVVSIGHYETQAKRFAAARQFDKADQALQSAVAILQNEPNYGAPERAKLFALVGSVKMELKDYLSASHALDQALTAYEESGKNKRVKEMIDATLKLAGCYEILSIKDLRERPLAAKARQNAEILYEELLRDGTDTDSKLQFRQDRVSNLRRLAFDYSVIGECELAEKTENAEVEFSQKYLVPANVFTRDYNVALGDCLLQSRQYNKALKHFRNALTCMERHADLRDEIVSVKVKTQSASCNEGLDTRSSRQTAVAEYKELLESEKLLPNERIAILKSLITVLKRQENSSEAKQFEQRLSELVPIH